MVAVQAQPFSILLERTASRGLLELRREFSLKLVQNASQEAKEANLMSILRGIVEDALALIRKNGGRSTLADAMPRIPTADGMRMDEEDSTDLSVKEWSRRGVGAEAQAIQEVLEDFKNKMVFKMQSTKRPTSQKITAIAHAYIMCRVDSGFHCFGLFVEKDIAPPESRTKLLFFDPSHGPYVQTQTYRVDTVKYLASLPTFLDQYDPYCMVPLWHFRLDPENKKKFPIYGIQPENQMAPVKKVLNQLALHRGNECGMISYFAMAFFATVHSCFSKSLLQCLDLCPIDFVHIHKSAWDSEHPRPNATNCTLQSETIPASCMPSFAKRLANCEQFQFKALAFPKAFEVFSEFTPLGEIYIDGVKSQHQDQPWINDLRKAELLPTVGDTCFRKNSYLSLLLPCTPVSGTLSHPRQISCNIAPDKGLYQNSGLRAADMLSAAHSPRLENTAKHNELPNKTSCPNDKVPSATLHEASLAEEKAVPNCAEVPYLNTWILCPKMIQYALALAFILASLVSAMFATTCLSNFIWRTANAIFANLANISDAIPEEIERSSREAHMIDACDNVKVVMTRRYVHGMRYWQDMAMTVVLLDDHTIFYNPVPMPFADMRSLAHGKHVLVVVPNMYHHMFVNDDVTTFPSALLVGSQSAAKRHTTRLEISSPSTVVLPAEVELLHVDGWALDEYIIVVHNTRLFSAAHFISCGIELSVGGATMLPACLKSAVRKATHWHSAGCLSLYERLTVSDKAAVASFVWRLRTLELRTIISAHRGICEDDAQELLHRVWGWAERMKATSWPYH